MPSINRYHSSTSSEPAQNDDQVSPIWMGIPLIVVPTLITSLSAMCGLVAIKLAMENRFELAVALILVAAVLDCLDGLAARCLRCTSHFGMELDSLADFLSFGIAPGLAVYFWSLEEIPVLGFMISSIYVLSCAYRLARFNAGENNAVSIPRLEGYFQGIPAPAAAACALLPLIIVFATGSDWPQNWGLVASVLTVTAFLMISTFPTFSSKAILPMLKPQVILIGLAGVFALLVYNLWGALGLLIIAYISSLPLASVKANRSSRIHEGNKPR